MEIKELLNGLLVTVVGGVVGIIGAYARRILKKIEIKVDTETAKIQNDETRKLVDSTFDKVNNLVVSAVTTAETTTVASLKKANEDGKLTTEDGQIVLDEVKDKVLNQLNDEGKELLQSAISDLDTYVEDLIHKTLAEITGKVTTK